MKKPKELLVIRFRLSALFIAGALAAVAATFAHPASAAGPKAAATASPSPSPAPTPTPETLDKQIPRLEAALKANPNDKDAMSNLAMDYLQVNRPDLALQLTQKLLAGGTKNAQIYYVDGEANTATGKVDAGIASMEQAANLEPTNILILQSLTQMYMRANRPADAERVAKRATTFNATSKEAAENYGFVLAAEKKYDEARAQFEAAVKLDPKDPHPIVLEAQTYEDANALPLAMQQLDRALAVQPNGLEALAAKGELASAQHDIKTAVDTYTTILGLMTDDQRRAQVVDQIAIAYAREKDDTNADLSFRKAIDNYGGLPIAHLAYGDYLASKKDNAGALREWTAALGPNRDNPEALARLGQAAQLGNDFGKAIDNFKRLTEVDASDPRAYMMLGAAYMQNKNYTSARDTFKAAYNLQPSADSLLGLAAADQATRNYSEAIQIYEAIDKNAAPIYKQHPELLFSMANAYRSANQPQKAKATFQRLLAVLKPNTQGYTQVKQIIADIDRGSAPKPAPKKTTAHVPLPKSSPTAAPKK